MILTLDLSPEIEQQLQEQAARESMDIKHYAEAILDNRLDLLAVLIQALRGTPPLSKMTARRKVGFDHGFLTLIQAITALGSGSGMPSSMENHDYRQNLLNNAVRLYSLQIVSLGLAAQLAEVSQAEFIDALGKAGVSVFQYGADEIIAEAEAA